MISLEKIDLRSNTRARVKEPVALEAPTNIFLNGTYVITLLSTPKLRKELALGWLFDEGILRSLDEVKGVAVSQENVDVTTKLPLEEDRLQVVGVTRIVTTACGLSTKKFFEVIRGAGVSSVKSSYKIGARSIPKMIREFEDRSRVYRLTGGAHAAALFEEGRVVAFAEDIDRTFPPIKSRFLSMRSHELGQAGGRYGAKSSKGGDSDRSFHSKPDTLRHNCGREGGHHARLLRQTR